MLHSQQQLLFKFKAALGFSTMDSLQELDDE